LFSKFAHDVPILDLRIARLLGLSTKQNGNSDANPNAEASKSLFEFGMKVNNSHINTLFGKRRPDYVDRAVLKGTVFL